MIGPVAVVPTLGGLHAGHEALIHAAKKRASTVVATLFLNPTQFGETEDLRKYPANRDQDLEIMRNAGVNAVFAPSVEEMYPPGDSFIVDPGPIAQVLEGQHRPGHMQAVATVVAKLFNATRPDLAYFGEKDAQQLEVVRRLSRDLCFGIEIVAVGTVRDDRNIALSSRLAYLTPDERLAAEVLYRSLCAARDLANMGQHTVSDLETAMRSIIAEESLATLDYAVVVDPETFEPPNKSDTSSQLQALIALKIGSTRLIDNLRIS